MSEPTRDEVRRARERDQLVEAVAPSRQARTFLWIFSVAMVLTAGTAFVFKLYEFYMTATARGSESLASFLIPVATYLTVAAGFFCLFMWAYSSGQFRDVEAPKYRMLELNAQIDELERRSVSHG